jgi:hypothetical protein
MSINEKTIIKYFDIIVKELDDVSFFSVNNILIDNQHLKVNNQEEKDFLFDISDKIKTFGISRGYFQKNGENGWLKLTEKGIDLKDSKKGYFKYIKGANQKFEFTYDGIISYLKSNRIVAVILVAIVIFLGTTKIINEYSKAKENIEKLNGDSNKKHQNGISEQVDLSNDRTDKNDLVPTMIDSLKLPYLKNAPILDKGIFLRYNYNDLLVGGANIDSIKINARTYDGESLELNIYDGKVKYDITRNPYIEMEYKGIIYSIEILGRHYSYRYVLRRDILPTLNLVQVNN